MAYQSDRVLGCRGHRSRPSPSVSMARSVYAASKTPLQTQNLFWHCCLYSKMLQARYLSLSADLVCRPSYGLLIGRFPAVHVVMEICQQPLLLPLLLLHLSPPCTYLDSSEARSRLYRVSYYHILRTVEEAAFVGQRVERPVEVRQPEDRQSRWTRRRSSGPSLEVASESGLMEFGQIC